jgi:adenylate cyclase
VLLALAVAVPLVAAHHLGFLATLQVAASDLLFKTRPARGARSTVIVGIDQRSYRALLPEHGPLSHWPRTLYARALDALRAPAGGPGRGDTSDAGPRVVAFEVFFDGARPEDAQLAEAMRASGNVVTPAVAQGPRDFDPAPGVAQRFDVFVRPPHAIREAAAGEGLANITVAPDSVVRGLPLILRAGDETVPAVPLTIAALYARRPRVLDPESSPGTVHAAGRVIPVGEADTMTINFLGPPARPGRRGSIPIVSFADVLDGTFDRSVVRDRIVLIGPTILGVDEHATPTTTQTRMWGVEVLAHAVETVVHQRYLAPAPRWATWAAIGVLALSAAALVGLGSPWVASLAVALVLVAYLTLAAALFEAGVIVNLVYPVAALGLTFAVTLAHRVVFAESDRRMVREVMGRYLSPSVGRWILADPRRLTLGGELREMTVLFVDLREFTTLAHAVPPETLVALLNQYRAAMTDVVFAHDGVLVQYAGDAIEAFWNAPMDQPDHARRACQAALGMASALTGLRREFELHGWGQLDVGIGINTGPMVVGNFGSRRRLEYAVVGDAVNVAARVEGLSKVYGVHIVAGEDTRAAARPAFAWRFLDRVVVKGRPVPISVFEVVARAGDLDAAAAAHLERYHEGIELYRARRFVEAESLFADLAKQTPGDGPVALYHERSRQALLDPPPPDWDRIHVARTK